MIKIKKMLATVLGVGLLNVCFGLTLFAKSEDFKLKEKRYGIVLDYYFENSGMDYGKFKKQEDPTYSPTENFNLEILEERNKPTKKNVTNLLAFYLMVSGNLNNSKKNFINKKSKKRLNESVLNIFLLLPCLIGTTKEDCVLNGDEMKWLKKNLTKESLRKVKITEEMFKKAKYDIVKFMDSLTPFPIEKSNLNKLKELIKRRELKIYFEGEGKKKTNSQRKEIEKNANKYIENLVKIKNFVLNSKLEDVKKAVLNFEDFYIRITSRWR